MNFNDWPTDLPVRLTVHAFSFCAAWCSEIGSLVHWMHLSYMHPVIDICERELTSLHQLGCTYTLWKLYPPQHLQKLILKSHSWKVIFWRASGDVWGVEDLSCRCSNISPVYLPFGIKLAFSMCLLQCLHCTDEAQIGRNSERPVCSTSHVSPQIQIDHETPFW